MRNILTILGREVAAFFDSLIAYIVIVVFLTGVGLFMWVFAGNVLENQQASLEILFSMGPWFYLFLIPAITMRSFAEEFKTGTIEMLSTKPVTDWQILIGKYLGAVILVFLALLPTLVYYFTIVDLGEQSFNLDTGATWGAYIGLFGIGAVYCAIGVFCSTLTSNQIVAFIAGVFGCFVMFMLFDFLAELDLWGASRDVIAKIGMAEHYRSISRGVVDSRDVVYFLSVTVLFLALGKVVLTARKQ